MPVIKVKEYEQLMDLAPDELSDLKDFALANQKDQQGNHRPVLVSKNDRLYAQNYVGIIETRKGNVIEILPKIDFAKDDEEIKRVFLSMLRTWRGFKKMAQFNASHIDAVRRFNMLEVFVHLFLTNLVLLTQRGLARNYQPVEDNLPCLRGRILFPQHIRENAVNRARFYVGYDEFTADRPVNRLIHSTIHKLLRFVQQPRNQQLLYQLRICFADIPESKRLEADWQQHSIDRSIQHYDSVMPWVGLFLFGHGLTTFAGKYVNRTLLFPMEDVFEDFVAASFQRHQRRFSVRLPGSRPRKYLVRDEQGHCTFAMKPDISLMSDGKTKFILDTKWKRVNEQANDRKHGISQADMYQLFAYGKKYGCEQVALIYPKTDAFCSPIHYEFDEALSLSCFPFDVTNPKGSVGNIVAYLEHKKRDALR